MEKITEQPSQYRQLEKMTVSEITTCINREDQGVAWAIEKALPQIDTLIMEALTRLKNGGRFFYIGTGSGGRLSVLDVIELPTTYGVPKGIFQTILAGGIDRLPEAPEEMEDDIEAGWKMLQAEKVSGSDFVVGISASGTTPFVLAALEVCRRNGIATGCIVSNPSSPIAAESDFPVEVITGPEFLTGSTRMKCGTAQKMIFDMISTTVMIQLGKVEDNCMVNMRLLNEKMVDRSVRMLMEKGDLPDYDEAKRILLESGSVKNALDQLRDIKKEG